MHAILEHCKNTLDFTVLTADPQSYQHLPACVIDTVFSIGARYTSTSNTVMRFCTQFGLTALGTLILGYPVAYFLSFRAGRWRNALLVGLMVPFWSSCLVAYYSWMIVLGKEGLLNTALIRFGFLSSPIGFLFTPFAILLGLVYFYLPFTVLPLYASLDKVPRSVIEAAYDLGAGRWTAFLKVTLPLSLPGVVAGCVLTFIPCLGDFLTVEILGGPRYYLLGNLISNQFMMAQDWPFGSALTTLLLAGLVGGLWLYQRWEKA